MLELPQSPEGEVSIMAAVVLGLVEGLTEFLPVSSTGHLILCNWLLGLREGPLTIGIQFGAITAILVLYWRRLWEALLAILQRQTAGVAQRAPNLWLLLVVAALPAVVLGGLFGNTIAQHLFSPGFVAVTLAVGGVLLVVLERWVARRSLAGEVHGLTVRAAFCIGLWQCLALLPGTSRAAATMAGGMVLGLSRAAAAEFSFLVGLPILYGACAKALLDDWQLVSGILLWPMLVAALVAFLTALVVVGPFVRFLRSHTFLPFAIYRVVVGATIGLFVLRGSL